MGKTLIRRATLLGLGVVCTMSAFAQSVVQGTVKDKSGEPLIGATIQIKGQQGGTVTDLDGVWKLSDLKPGQTIVVSYVGFTNKEIKIGQQRKLNIVLEPDKQDLDEVVVLGYAVGTKRTVSGAVERIGKKDMNQGVVTSAADALKGKVSGVVISQSGGDPMGTTNIRVRGTSSLSGGNDPLVIIDGVYGDMTMFNSLQPGDIESMTILKDASETAQYGSRGAAGVIVVTTTKGKNGTSSITYNGTFGVNKVFKNIEMLSADAYRATAKSMGLTFDDLGGNTNWLDEIERQTGITQNHNLAFSGGNDNGNYRASLGFIQKQGAIRNSDMRNYTAKLDAQQLAFNKKLKLEMGVMGSEYEGKQQYDMQKIFYSAASYNPTYPNTKNATTGKWDEDMLANEIYNPLGQLEIDNRYSVGVVMAHGKATWTIVDGLFLSAFGSYTKANIDLKRYIPNDIRQGELNGNGWAYINSIQRNDLMGNVQLTFTKDFGKHHIDALAVMEGQRYKTFTHMQQAKGFQTNYFKYNNLQAGANVSWGDVTSDSKEYTLSSYMARVNYMFADRYIVTANLRADGSSKLGSGHKWGWFPSASAAWVISKENFMKDVKWVNNFKLRAGYGVTGNQDAIDPYTSLALYGPNGVTPVNGTNTTTFAVQSNDNPDLKWETKSTFDVGLDLSLFYSRLNITLDWYTSKTKDLLYN
uniref:SusC/RagA family TonB-linked outer membrane protein n=1 Tax=Prevotella sp. TaxID=59823 RepID=UPI003FF00CEC